MTSKHGIAGLRADIPALEPDAVLLAQLVELSTAGAPAATTSRASSVKVLIAAAGVAVVAGTSWVAGAVPGTPHPAWPAHHSHTVVTPTAPPSRGGAATPTPGASGSTPLAPGSIPTPEGRDRGNVPGATPTLQQLGTLRPAGQHEAGHGTGHTRAAHTGSGGHVTPARPPHDTLWQDWKAQHGAGSPAKAPQAADAHGKAQQGPSKHGSGRPPRPGGEPGGREASPQ